MFWNPFTQSCLQTSLLSLFAATEKTSTLAHGAPISGISLNLGGEMKLCLYCTRRKKPQNRQTMGCYVSFRSLLQTSSRSVKKGVQRDRGCQALSS